MTRILQSLILIVAILAQAPAQWSELRTLEVDSKKLLPESMYPSYGSLAWTLDSKSFFYEMPAKSRISRVPRSS
ncbi:MAG TPA: hypothetical protein VH138_11870 [Vicinamibacterales bacterium]|jgi:hypothetical protein|nr:hypothetical protein [Vicinamibacterales bacterium]